MPYGTVYFRASIGHWHIMKLLHFGFTKWTNIDKIQYDSKYFHGFLVFNICITVYGKK